MLQPSGKQSLQMSNPTTPSPFFFRRCRARKILNSRVRHIPVLLLCALRFQAGSSNSLLTLVFQNSS